MGCYKFCIVLNLAITVIALYWTKFIQDTVIAIPAIELFYISKCIKTGSEAYQIFFKYIWFDCQVGIEGQSEEWTTPSQILANISLFIKLSYGEKKKLCVWYLTQRAELVEV